MNPHLNIIADTRFFLFQRLLQQQQPNQTEIELDNDNNELNNDKVIVLENGPKPEHITLDDDDNESDNGKVIALENESEPEHIVLDDDDNELAATTSNRYNRYM